MQFTGFTPEQFAVFEREGFTDRMLGIRTLVRPALQALGQDLAPHLESLAGHPLYPHVALHARRRVNPPDDTWVAFGRSERGYKAYAHFAVGIGVEGVYVGLVIKDESDDRATLGRQLAKRPGLGLAACKALEGYHLAELKGEIPAAATRITLRGLADSLVNRKTSTLHLVYPVPRADPRLSDAADVKKLALELLNPLKCWYEWSIGG